MPAFFPILETLLKRAFWYHHQFLLRFFFYLLNRSKTLSFYRCLQFWEEEKVSGDQVRWIRWLRHDYGFVFGQKLTHKHQCVSWYVITVQNPWLVFPQSYAFPMNCFAQSAHNFNMVFLSDRTTLWQEFMNTSCILMALVTHSWIIAFSRQFVASQVSRKKWRILVNG